jgi:hypothetical protein
MRKTAVDIKTEVWNNIISELKNNGWDTIFKYEGFDVGIDRDAVTLKNNKNQTIEFTWDNWSEGVITSEEEILKELENKFDIKFQRNKTK